MINPFSAFILMQLQEALGYFIIGCLHDAFDNDNSSKKNSVRKMLIQVFNAGSSSIKFAFYQHQSKLELLKGNLEKIGEASSTKKVSRKFSKFLIRKKTIPVLRISLSTVWSMAEQNTVMRHFLTWK